MSVVQIKDLGTENTAPATTDIYPMQTTAGVSKHILFSTIVNYILNLVGVSTTVTKNASYDITAVDGIGSIKVDTTSGDITIKLPPVASSSNRRIRIANVKGGTNKVIITCDSAASVLSSDLLAVLWLAKIGDYIDVQYNADAGYWEILDEKITAELIVNDYAGYGSTDTMILKFTNLISDVGNVLSHNHGSYGVNGLDVVIQKSGDYEIHFNPTAGVANQGFSITKNDNELTTYANVGYIYNLIYSIVAAYTGMLSTSVSLKKGDIIRFKSTGYAISSDSRAVIKYKG